MISSAQRFFIALFSLAWLGITSGCTTVGYYHQAISGHLGLMLKREPIEQLISSDETDPELVQQLAKIEQFRNFSRDHLELPSKNQYTSYVDTGKRFVVWNVFAAPPLSLEPRQWCYPVAGCASYRGYYSEQRARRYAATLAAEGMDVYVGGTTAYSTLGWFNDPVLNTFINRRDDQLADLIFHELAHQLLYIPGDTVFNESFASLVAREGVKRWFLARHDDAKYSDYLRGQSRKQQFIDLVTKYRTQLKAVYATTLPEASKQQLISDLQSEHQKLKISWGGHSPYDRWFELDINNAQLNTVATYYDLVPALAALLAKHGGQLDAFYSACRELKSLDIADRHARLNALLEGYKQVYETGTARMPAPDNATK